MSLFSWLMAQNRNWLADDFIGLRRFSPPRRFRDDHGGGFVDWFPENFPASHEFAAASELVRIVKWDGARLNLRLRLRLEPKRDFESVSELKKFHHFSLLNFLIVMLSVLP